MVPVESVERWPRHVVLKVALACIIVSVVRVTVTKASVAVSLREPTVTMTKNVARAVVRHLPWLPTGTAHSIR